METDMVEDHQVTDKNGLHHKAQEIDTEVRIMILVNIIVRKSPKQSSKITLLETTMGFCPTTIVIWREQSK